MNFIRKRAGIIVIVLVAILLAVWVGSGLTSDGRAREEQPVERISEEIPVFKNEGNLWFISSTGDTITQISIETADSEYETTRGLMYRKSMGMQEGMLFTFPVEDLRSFWMKNTYLPLDIIYADANGVIGSVQANTIPYSEASLPSDKPAKYVVEVNAGFFEKYNLKPGDKISFNRID